MSSEKQLYVIVGVDDQECGPHEPANEPRNGSKLRIGNYPEHMAYQKATSDPSSSNFIKKVTAGPMVNDEGNYMNGSMIVVEGQFIEQH
eukprot:17685-Heterococcus_DN1.PRE.1